MKYKTIFIICISFFLLGKQKSNAQADTFNYISDSIQTWTVPPCVYLVTVTAIGATGGNTIGYIPMGGAGAMMVGTFTVTPGEVFKILVGGAGQNGIWGGGGGGGSFVTTNVDTPLIIAGGGGGVSVPTVGYVPVGINAVTTTSGVNGYSTIGGYPNKYGIGGTLGSGATNNVPYGPCGGNGGGLLTNGAYYSNCCINNTFGVAFVNGGYGGLSACNVGGIGGFGGGGGSGFSGGGGGGGYSGGGGSWNNPTNGGGGGSYNGGSNQSNTAAYNTNGNGQIIIFGGTLSSVVSGQTNPICGICDGSLKIEVNGGSSPYTYYWSPGGQTTDSATGLCAGTYTITVTDSCGDVFTAPIVLSANPLPVATSIIANPKCNGNCTGSTTATVNIGTSPYTYLWTPSGGTTNTATGLCAGVYTIMVTDTYGCTGTATATITQPSALTLTQWTNNVVCTGGIDSATVTPSGGTSPYTYFWNPSAKTTATVTGLNTGTYTVDVTDMNGCTESINISILRPLTVLNITMGTVNALCYGDNGSATVTAAGGTSPYTYLWTPSNQSTATANGLGAGVYNVTVTDSNGCMATASVTITQPLPLTATIRTVNNVLCYGDTGNATVTGTGGILPYTYVWTPTTQTTATATGLRVGTYTVTITDNNGCTATTTATLTQPTQVTASISVTSNIPCNGETGSATITGAGGVSPYTYLWNPTNQSTATATGLSARTYTATVTDKNGCTATASVTMTQPAVLTATMGTINKIKCNGGVGTATVIGAGGTIPYTYLWTAGSQTTATANSLSVGTYSVTITDKNHCTASATVTMTQPITLSAAITSTTNISCFNGGNGAASVRAGGGTTPYTYLWTPSSNTNSNATGLFAVSYTITVTDSNGCTATTRTTLTQPNQLTVNITEPQIICKDSTGTLLANANGGTAPYKYTWSNGFTSMSNKVSITPISTIYYTVTITDANGCTASNSITLQYGPSFGVNITGKNSVCVGDSTSICANAVGAIYGANYYWQPVNSNNPCIKVAPTNASEVYTVTVIDGCGSTTTATTAVYTEPTPQVNMFANLYQGCEPLCIQFRNSTTITKGGIRQYVWTFGTGDTSFSANPVYCYKNSGGYSVSLTVISDSGCNATLKKIDMITVYSPPKAAFTYSPQSTTIENPTITFKDESRDASDTSSRGGIVYRIWKFGDETDSTSNLQTPIHTYKDTGTYCATLFVMNAGGCTDTVTNCLVIDPAFKLYIPSAFTPNGDGRNEVFKPVGQYIKSYEMYIFDRWGLQLYHSTDMGAGWDGKLNGSIVQEDVYIYKIMVIDSKDNVHSYVGNVTLLK